LGWLWFLNLPIYQGGSQGRSVTDVELILAVDERTVATALFAKRAAVDGNSAWIVSI
jgi:hypothetical protein